MNVPLYRFKGQRPGPKVYIQSSIHGAEVQGNVVIYHLVQLLNGSPDILLRSVLIHCLNPLARIDLGLHASLGLLILFGLIS